jgi:hypothetical protein
MPATLGLVDIRVPQRLMRVGRARVEDAHARAIVSLLVVEVVAFRAVHW